MTSRILPDAIPLRRMLPFWYDQPQTPIKQKTLDAITGEVKIEAVLMYTELAKIIETCRQICCVYHADRKDYVLHYPLWKDTDPPSVEMCKRGEESIKKQFHLRVKTGQFTFTDEKLEPLESGMEVSGLAYGKYSWESSQEKSAENQKKYLLCDMGKHDWNGILNKIGECD